LLKRCVLKKEKTEKKNLLRGFTTLACAKTEPTYNTSFSDDPKRTDE
jgi:hypothetical protein